MSRSKPSNILPARKVILDKRKLVFRDEPQTPAKVTLIREGKIVRTIEIQCCCGEQLHLDCLYEDQTTDTVE